MATACPRSDRVERFGPVCRFRARILAKARGLASGFLLTASRVIRQRMTKGHEDVELHWTAGDGGVLCGSEDFGTVTSRREVFDEYERRHLVCHRCAQVLHA